MFGSASGILGNADGLHLFGYPVVITSACTNYVSTTVTGPVFGRLDRFMSLRRVNGLHVQVLRERFADSLQVGVQTYLRADFGARGEPTSMAFSK